MRATVPGTLRVLVLGVLGGLLTLALGPCLRWAMGDEGRRAMLSTTAWQAPVLGNTLVLGAGQAVLVTWLAGLLAAVQNLCFPGRRLLHIVVLTPLVTPAWTMALGLVMLLGNSGLLRSLMPGGLDVYGLPGLVLAGSLQVLPFAYLAMLAAERSVDAQLLDQARMLGLDQKRARRQVAWPRLLPATAATALVVFVEAITDLANPAVLGGGYPVLASRVHLAVSAEYDLAGAAMLALLLAVPALLLHLAARPLGGRGRFRLLRSGTPAPRHVPSPGEWSMVFLAGLVGLVQVLVLGAVLLGSVASSIGVDAQPTTAYLRQALRGAHGEAFGYGLLLALLALPVTGTAAMVIALAAHGRGRLARLVRMAAWSLGALPGLLVGLSVMLVVHTAQGHKWSGGPFGWVTAVAIIMVHVLRSLPAVVTALLARLDLEPRVTRDAARLHGVGLWRRLRVHWWPQLAPELGRGLCTSLLRTLGAVGSVVFLTNSHVGLLSVRALTEVDAGRVGAACAMAVWLAAVGCLVLAVCHPVLGAREED